VARVAELKAPLKAPVAPDVNANFGDIAKDELFWLALCCALRAWMGLWRTRLDVRGRLASVAPLVEKKACIPSEIAQ